MRQLIYLLSLTVIALSINAQAAPRRRAIHNDRSPPGQDRQTRRDQKRQDRREARRDQRRQDRREARRDHQAHRRVIEATPVNQQSPRREVINPQSSSSSANRQERAQRRQARRQQRKVERRQSRKQSRRQQRRIERRQSRKQSRRQQRRIERRQAREQSRGHQRRIQPRRTQRRHRRHRRIPVYVSSPTRVVVGRAQRPQYNNDRFFDHLYHDGERYGVNGDLRDEERRINRGIRRGLITPTEAQHLQAMLFDAYDLETDCVNDGYLTLEEEADLYWAERDLNRSIRWEMRDFDTW